MVYLRKIESMRMKMQTVGTDLWGHIKNKLYELVNILKKRVIS